MFNTVLVLCILNSPMCPQIFTDQHGPWSNPNDCMVRGATIIHEMSKEVPIISAQVFCKLSLTPQNPKDNQLKNQDKKNTLPTEETGV